MGCNDGCTLVYGGRWLWGAKGLLVCNWVMSVCGRGLQKGRRDDDDDDDGDTRENGV